MDEREAFVAAIQDQPDDDVPRLVFADWLEEHDEAERAEFIRLQCELHPIRYQWHLPDVRRLLHRERQLLKQFRSRWLTDLAEIPPEISRTWLPFERGFPVRMVQLRQPQGRPLNGSDYAFQPLRQLVFRSSRIPDSTLTDTQVVNRWHTIEIVDRLNNTDIAQLCQAATHSMVRVIRIWSGASAQLLRELWRLARVPRPAFPKIELVHWFDSRSPSTPRGWYHDPRHEEPLKELQTLPPEKFEWIKPLDWGFTLCGDLGGGYFAGHLKSGSPALVAIRGDARRVYLTTFDEQGNFSKTLWEDQFGQPWTLEAIQKRFGFTLGVIPVKEFRSGRLVLKAYSQEQMEAYLNHFTQTHSPVEIGRQLLVHLYYWRSFTLELDGVEHRVLYPIDAVRNELEGDVGKTADR